MDHFIYDNCYVIEVAFMTPAYDDTLQLRDKILRKPLGLSFTTEDLSKEYADFHLACYSHEEELLGCMVLNHINSKIIKMRQVAVDDAYQGKGFGKCLVDACEKFVLAKSYKKIELNARDNAIPFYEKLAYQKIGKPFTEVSIKHYKMFKDL